MNKYQVDKFIKSEVESIDYNGGQEAWELFDANRNKDSKPTPVPVFAMWKPLAAAASVAVFCGILLHQSLVDEPGVIAENKLATVEQPNAEIESAISVKINEDVINNITVNNTQVVETLLQIKKDLPTQVNQEEVISLQLNTIGAQNSVPVIVDAPETNITRNYLNNSQSPTQVTMPVEGVQYAVVNQSNRLMTPQNRSTQITPPVVPNNQIKSADRVLPILNLAAIDMNQEVGNFALDLSENLVKSKRKKMRLFAEFGIGNRQAGKQAIVGLSIPKDSWSLEAGLGLNHKINDPLEYTDISESNIEDYDETHHYTFTQKLNAIFPLKIRKRFGKRHAMLVGVQGSYNISNQVDIHSSIPVRSSSLGGSTGSGGFVEGEIEYFDVNYKYTNANSVINSFALVSSNRWNLDLSAGYEFNFDRVALGLNVMRPVFSTFSVSEELSSPVRFKITEQTRLNLSLKYYLG